MIFFSERCTQHTRSKMRFECKISVVFCFLFFCFCLQTTKKNFSGQTSFSPHVVCVRSPPPKKNMSEPSTVVVVASAASAAGKKKTKTTTPEKTQPGKKSYRPKYLKPCLVGDLFVEREFHGRRVRIEKIARLASLRMMENGVVNLIKFISSKARGTLTGSDAKRFVSEFFAAKNHAEIFSDYNKISK